MATPTAHARISPSNAHRWCNCTAAPTFEANFPNETSVYAEEGTLAHAICEIYATRKFGVNLDRKKLNRDLAKLKKNPLYNDEMLATAEAYVDYLVSKAMTFEHSPFVQQEVKVDISDYVPECFGTCDCIMIGGDTLHITDYKHGKGVRVEAIGNHQMRLYALGALKMFAPIYAGIKTVSMGICQPRISDEASEETMTVEQLLEWGESIKPIAKEAFYGPGTFAPGEWCRFCKGKAKCRARAEQNSALADFKDCVPQGSLPKEYQNLDAPTRAVIGVPNMLTDAEIGELLIKGAELVEWFKSLQEYALGAILNGKDVPGWKVVAGRSNRAFKDADKALKIILDNGFDEDKLYEPRKAKSLSALEKVVGRKKFAEILGDEIVKPLGKPTLATADDEREAYNTAAADFSGVTENAN